MKRSVLTVIFLTIFISLFGQTKDNRLEGLDEEIVKWMTEYNAVGISIAIVENNEVLYNKGFGYRDLENKNQLRKIQCFQLLLVLKRLLLLYWEC